RLLEPHPRHLGAEEVAGQLPMIGDPARHLGGKAPLALGRGYSPTKGARPAARVVDMPFQLPFATMRGGGGVDRYVESFLRCERVCNENTNNTERSKQTSPHCAPSNLVEGKPSLIVGIQRRKPSIRTPFTARFQHSQSSTEGRHVPAPVGGCRRPHRHHRTSVDAESRCTTAATRATPAPPSPTSCSQQRHRDNGRAERWGHHSGLDAARRIPLA